MLLREKKKRGDMDVCNQIKVWEMGTYFKGVDTINGAMPS